jgi:hypothetical protein
LCRIDADHWLVGVHERSLHNPVKEYLAGIRYITLTPQIASEQDMGDETVAAASPLDYAACYFCWLVEARLIGRSRAALLSFAERVAAIVIA